MYIGSGMGAWGYEAVASSNFIGAP